MGLPFMLQQAKANDVVIALAIEVLIAELALAAEAEHFVEA
jgi:hypothetical protein